jgi:hypothetical protein
MLVRTSKVRAMSRAAACLALGACAVLTAVPFAGDAGASVLAQAKTHLLKLSDMPKGWATEKGTGGNGGSNKFPGASQLASCIGVPPKLITSNPPEVDSPYYENKSGSLEVQDSVTVFPSVKNAQAEYLAMSNAKTPTCLTAIANGQAFKSQLAAAGGEGAVIGTITVVKRSTASYAPGTTSLTMDIPITDQGVNITAQLTEVFFIKGNLGQQISFNSYNATFPASLSRSLTALAEGKL